MRKSNLHIRGQRTSVSAEVYGMFNKKENFVAKVIPKSDEQRQRIISRVMQSFLFNSLEDSELNTVINAFEERKFSKGDYVIKQGDHGDVLYLVETGTLSCFKKFPGEDSNKFLKNYHPGEAFGELALLYNAPRAATIQSDDECTLWALDRETFNHIVKDAAM
jgi:cAMP-dependent protein kinase regulator